MNFEVHYEKYQKFKDSAEQDRYIPSRIEDYFKSAFHLIESVVVKKFGLHIQKHQKVRTVLKQNVKNHPSEMGGMILSAPLSGGF